MKISLLVCDAAPFARQFVKDILLNGGYKDVREAASREQALRLCEKKLPNIVILSISSEDGAGLALLKELLQLYPNLIIIVNAAEGQEFAIEEAFDLGATAYIEKPTDAKRLLHLVEHFMRETGE